MSKLTDFLRQQKFSKATKTVRISKDIPLDFTIKTLSAKKHKAFQDQCMIYGSKRKKEKVSFNSEKFQTLICIECTLDPNFSEAKLIEE